MSFALRMSHTSFGHWVPASSLPKEDLSPRKVTTENSLAYQLLLPRYASTGSGETDDLALSLLSKTYCSFDTSTDSLSIV